MKILALVVALLVACQAGETTTPDAGQRKSGFGGVITPGGVVGTGTSGTITKWVGGAAVGNAGLSDNGSTISTSEALSVSNGLTVTGGATIDAFNVGVLAPTAIAGTVNDWNPTGLQNASTIQVTTSSSVILTGLVAPTGSSINGREICLQNTSVNTINLSHQSTGSVAANRFVLLEASTWQLGGVSAGTAGMSICFTYDVPTSRWVQTATSSTLYPKFSVGGAIVLNGTGLITGLQETLSGPSGIPAGNFTDLALTDTHTFDTTTAPFTSFGVSSSITSSRSSGANNLTNLAGYFNATGAQVNRAIQTDAGDNVFNAVSGSSTFSNGLAVTGNTTVGSLNTGVLAVAMTIPADDWNPTGLQTANYIQATSSSQGNFSGIAAPTGSVSGRQLCIQNVGGNTINVLHNSSNSLAANRLWLVDGQGWILRAGGTGSGSTICFVYDLTNSRWNQIANVQYPELFIGPSGQVTLLGSGVMSGGTLALAGPGGTPGASTSTLTVAEAATFNTGSTPMTSFGVNSSITTVRGTGTAALTNLAGYFNSTGAQVNRAIQTDAGDNVFNAVSGTSVFTSATNKGTVTLVAGSGTVTVTAGAVCVCSDTTAVAAVRCTVAATTMTATGTGTDVLSYLCF